MEFQDLNIPPFPYDPYAVFRGSRTPPGLYARQKWLDEAHSERWRMDFKSAVSDLYHGQRENGSWYDSPIETIHRLFGLHLTVREAEPNIQAAIDWLLDKAAAARKTPEGPMVSKDQLRGLPFTSTRTPFLLIPATLFLAAIFGKHSDHRAAGLYQDMIGVLSDGKDTRYDAAEIHNAFRALVVHPIHAEHALTQWIVRWLGKRQSPEGHWGREIPFYQAMNAIAHLDLPGVPDQLESAFARLSASQQPDGTWSDCDREWNTFLVVHALRNRRLL